MQGKVEVKEVNTQKKHYNIMYIHLETHYNMMYGICKLTIGIRTTINNHKSITCLGCSEWIEHVVVVF